MSKTLKIFDMDGTLIDRATGKFLPGVLDELRAAYNSSPEEHAQAYLAPRPQYENETFDAYQTFLASYDGRDYHDQEDIDQEVKEAMEWQQSHYFAIATNQGGVGLRHWMEQGGFGDPSGLPTQAEIDERVEFVRSTIEQVTGRPCAAYVSYRYQSKSSGKWSPIPAGHEDDPRWSAEWRKPQAGMILQAMEDFEIEWPERLFRLVGKGDKVTMIGDSAEDKAAAETAGVSFTWHVAEFVTLGNPQHEAIEQAQKDFRRELEEAWAISKARKEAIASGAPLEEVGDFLMELGSYEDDRLWLEREKWMQSNFEIAPDNLYFYGLDQSRRDDYMAWKPYFDSVRAQMGDGATWNEVLALTGATRTIGEYDQWHFTDGDKAIDLYVSVGDPRSFKKWRMTPL